MSKSEVVISLKNVGKTYRQYKNNFQKIQFLLLKRDVGKKEEVLKGVSLQIKKGEKIGILGHQQSGKTTLMRIIAGIIRPDTGKIRVEGKVTPILDVRLGFEPALSGKNNYVLMSSALGWSSKEIKDHEKSVFSFAKLSKEKDMPIKSYQKGAAARLGFTTATEIGSDIILYDAGFAFGSNAWNEKCKERLKQLISGDTTFIMSVKKATDAAELCERGIVLDKGSVAFDGSFEEALEYYRATRKAKSGKKAKNKEEPDIEIADAEEEAAEEYSRDEDHDEE